MDRQTQTDRDTNRLAARMTDAERQVHRHRQAIKQAKADTDRYGRQTNGQMCVLMMMWGFMSSDVGLTY